MSLRCKHIIQNQYVERATEQQKLKGRTDAMEVDDILEDDPPLDWEVPIIPDHLMNITREFHKNQESVPTPPIECTEPETLQSNEDSNSNNNGIIHEVFPGVAGLTCGGKKNTFEEMREKLHNRESEVFRPFRNCDEWELAEWLMSSGLSQAGIDQFLKLKITSECMKLSFRNATSLLAKIDELPYSGEWKCQPVTIYGDVKDYNGDRKDEVVDVWFRNPINCIKELIGNPMFRDQLTYAPERLFADESKDEEIINEMWTARWWWNTQELLPHGATIVPIIIASDKTQLSQFSGDKQAWPVYLTIGNIAKSIRRQPSKQATVLLGYLPVTKLECLSPKARKDRAYRLFHYCMSIIMEPLKSAGRDGIMMGCADNQVRHVFPILAAYVADYPEQCLVACTKENSCPVCTISPKERGEPVFAPVRDSGKTVKAINAHKAREKCKRYDKWNLRAVPEPFWKDLPHTNISECFTPDILHQLHKGVFKDHLVKWCIEVVGTHGAIEIDSRFRAMPSFPGVRHFQKGISTISQWTGREYKEMERVFASLIHGAVSPEVSAVARAVVDFIYYASFQSHSTETLRRLQDALDTFHAYKSIFIKYGIRQHFRIPKIHMMEHYVHFILSKGSADGFNTEASERLHIDYAKAGYRASNKKDYTDQMVLFLTRREKIHRFKSFLIWMKATDEVDSAEYIPQEEAEEDEDGECNGCSEVVDTQSSSLDGQWCHAKKASKSDAKLMDIINSHGAVDMVEELAMYLDENIPECKVIPSEADLVDVYTRISTNLPSLQQLNDTTERNVIRANPAHPQKGRKKAEAARFDTVLVHMDPDAEDTGLEGYQAARVRVLFKLPPWFGCSKTLAYVEWFTKFSSPVEHLRMTQVSYSNRYGRKRAEIIPISSIRRSCFMTPKFGKRCDPNWTSSNVLDKCNQFFLNSHLNVYMFQMCDGDFVLDKEE